MIFGRGVLRKMLRKRGLGVNLIAGFCFIALMVYGWGLRWSQVGSYLLLLLLALVFMIGLAALSGWALRKILDRKKM